MVKGVVLCKGDETTCGGRIIAATALCIAFGKPQAREGDPVTCGKDGKTYKIIGGISFYTTGPDNKRVAGSLDSFSSCPCKAKFLPSNSFPVYSREESLPPKNASMMNSASLSTMLLSKSEQKPEQHAQAAKKKTGVDAGFAVLPYGGTTAAWQRLLFTGQVPVGAKNLFATLNGEDKKYKAGSIMLVVDPKNQDSKQIAHMQAAKERIDAALEPLTHKEANFLHQHYATIANFSNIADKGIGLSAEPAGKYFESIEKILKEIQETYKNTYLTHGALSGDQFNVRRAQLFKELETVLKVGFLNKAMKLGQYTKIKNALGLSSSSIIHKWNETGIGDIEGYATHIERAAKYVKAMRYTGYLGISFSFSGLHSLNEIHEACSVGRKAECSKKKYTEIGSFALGTGGGILAGGGAIPLCVTIGVGTAGVGGLVCSVIVGVGLGYAGSTVGSAVGELSGEQLYDVFGN